MRTLIFVIVAVMTLIVSVAAQTSLSLWPYYVEVTPENNAPGMHDMIVPLAIFDKSGADLGDFAVDLGLTHGRRCRLRHALRRCRSPRASVCSPSPD